ncbi:sulfatase-like hydrolase/transferase [Aliiglaciecola lipolytica]
MFSLSLISCSSQTDLKANTESKPNVIIIMADDLGYGDLSSYGGKYNTPNLDKMAEGGLRFTDFHSSGTLCSPTRAGLVTGLYQQRTTVDGVVNANSKHPAHQLGVDPEKIISYPKLMKANGYKNALFGKWHLGYLDRFHPMNFGFDKFVGYLSGNIDYISHYDRMEIFDWWHDREQVVENGYSTHLITEQTVSFIEENKHSPFTILVAHEAVHSPIQGPNDPIQRGPNKVKRVKLRPDQETFALMLRELDKSVGEILQAVHKAGIGENTLIIFTSDNGPMSLASAGILRGKKGSIYEGGHRVPSIAYWPSVIEANTTTDQTVISLDLVPTMLSVTNTKQPPDYQFDGVNIMPVFKGQDLPERMLFWRNGGSFKTSTGLTTLDSAKAMRDGKWKLVAAPYFKQIELFDLSNDLQEKNNIANKHPQRVESMLGSLKEWENEMLTYLPYQIIPEKAGSENKR